VRKELTLFIGVRWRQSLREDIAKRTESFLETLTRSGLEKGMPLHWNLPNTPYLEKKNPQLDGIITEIKLRLSSRNDCIIPMGYSGAAHPLLTARELEKELEWGISNSWKTGIVEQFKVRPHILIPGVPDPLRADLVKVYKKTGFTLIGLPADDAAQKTYGFGPWLCHEPVEYFLYQELKAAGKTAGDPLPFGYPKQAPYLFILLDLAQEDIHQRFEEFIRRVSRRFHVRYGSLKKDKPSRPKKQPELHPTPHPALTCNPLGRVYLNSATTLRGKEKKTDTDTRNILKLVSFNNWDLDAKKISLLDSARNKSFLHPRVISAHMPGDVTLPGTHFNAVFSEGKLHSLVKAGKNYLTGAYPRSLAGTARMTCKYTTGSVFSFEDENSRGLLEKSTCSLPAPAGESTIIREYYFVDDFPYLIITMEVTYTNLPPAAGIVRLVPFELPVARFNRDQAPVLYCLYSDGSQSAVKPPDLSAVYTVGSSLYYLSLEESYLVFGFVPHRNPLIGTIQLRTEQQNHDYYLLADILGTSIPVETALYDHTKEVCSLFIGISDHAPKKIPFFPQGVLGTIPHAHCAAVSSS
jgi:hypothetical protein